MKIILNSKMTKLLIGENRITLVKEYIDCVKKRSKLSYITINTKLTKIAAHFCLEKKV